MPPKSGNKNKSRNAFYYFMLDFKERSSTNYADMQQVADAAGPHWQKMTTEQRKPYEQKAKTNKSGGQVIKYTTTGVNIAVMQRREEEAQVKIQRMKDDIENTIQAAIEGECIEEQMFYFIHVNHYGYCNTTRKYLPCELAVSRFNLKNGILKSNVFHSIIFIGQLPQGYAYQAKKAAEDTHQILHDDEALPNFSDVASQFMAFMHEFSKKASRIPPLYVAEKNKEAAESVAKELCYYGGCDDDYVKLYSLEYLFYTLRNAVGKSSQPVYPSIALSQLELEKDKYDFCNDIPCEYHQSSDVPMHCSRSHVIRLAYIICDNCCSDVDIDLIPGQHVPSDAKIVSRRPQSAASSTMGTGARSTNRAYGNGKSRDYFLSQRTESEMSAMSDTSSMYDPTDGSEISQVDSEEWEEAKPRHKRHEKGSSGLRGARRQAPPKCSTDVDGAWGLSRLPVQNDPSQNSLASNLADLHFTAPSGDEYSQSAVVSRRPVKPSAIFLSGPSSSSFSPGPSPFNTAVPRGRGRGRGLSFSANAPNKF